MLEHSLTLTSKTSGCGTSLYFVHLCEKALFTPLCQCDVLCSSHCTILFCTSTYNNLLSHKPTELVPNCAALQSFSPIQSYCFGIVFSFPACRLLSHSPPRQKALIKLPYTIYPAGNSRHTELATFFSQARGDQDRSRRILHCPNKTLLQNSTNITPCLLKSAGKVFVCALTVSLLISSVPTLTLA